VDRAGYADRRHHRLEYPDCFGRRDRALRVWIFLWTLAAAMFLPPAQPKAHLAPVSYKRVWL
jgi:hypothetical protein